MPVWTLKSKTLQQQDISLLLTPDSEEILVGENEDEILALAEAFSLWNLEDKTIYPQYLVYQNDDYFALQNGDLLITHNSPIRDWSLKSKL